MMYDGRLIERGIHAPSFETLENMAKRLRVEPRDPFDFRDSL
jgi:transcriptional regulator with XRE-family HTH domain